MEDLHLVVVELEGEGEVLVVQVLVAGVEAVVEEKRGDPATTEGSSLRNNIECSPRYNCLISSFVSGRSPVTGCFLCGGSDQTSLICGVIDDRSRSFKAIDERVFTNFRDKNAVFTNFRAKNTEI